MTGLAMQVVSYVTPLTICIGRIGIQSVCGIHHRKPMGDLGVLFNCQLLFWRSTVKGGPCDSAKSSEAIEDNFVSLLGVETKDTFSVVL
jgi:hypothetical protein